MHKTSVNPSFLVAVPRFRAHRFDILIDENLKPWLIEINHQPSLQVDTPLDLYLKKNIVLDTLNLVSYDIYRYELIQLSPSYPGGVVFFSHQGLTFVFRPKLESSHCLWFRPFYVSGPAEQPDKLARERARVALYLLFTMLL